MNHVKVLGFFCAFAASISTVSADAIAQTKQVPASADLPDQKKVCMGGVVSRQQLALFLLQKDPKWTAFALKVAAKYGTEYWRKIFTDPTLCKNNAICSSDDAAIISGLRITFYSFLQGGRLSGAYVIKNVDMSPETYFSGSDGANAIGCASSVTVVSKPPPSIDTSPVRLRGISDDLQFDRNRDPAFKATSQATISVIGDDVAQDTTKIKIQSALGYAFVTDFGDIVPYISTNQSITETQAKPTTTDPSSNVAFGILARTDFAAPKDTIDHVFLVKPQYLVNTKDQSQIASLKLIYAPWTFFPINNGAMPINLNTAVPISFLPGNVYGQLLFDIRNDAGTYVNRGNPTVASHNKDFDRVGSNFGIALTTSDFPSLTLTATETLLYGFVGSIRKISIFNTSLIYNINTYVGFKASYQHGIDEDTAVPVQSWTVGLSARY